MAHAEKEIIIGRPVSDVFRFFADGLNNPKWRPEDSRPRLGNYPLTASFCVW